MPRVKRGVGHTKRRKNLLNKTKGYHWGRKSKIKLAKTAVKKAGAYAYRDRKNKKRSFRNLWQVQINAGSRINGMSYSKLIGALKSHKIELDRKILSEIAKEHPEVFAKIVSQVK
jgi:large subunit ribosomal protein L20